MANIKEAKKIEKTKDFLFSWKGIDKKGKEVSGEIRATSDSLVKILLRSKGINAKEVKKQRVKSAKKIKPQDITMFTRQLATMMKAGVPLLQSFEIVANGHANPSVGKLLLNIKQDIESGSNLKQAFSKHPDYFDVLFCNLIGAGEAAGILETILDRLALYQEKMLAIKSKIKAALFYPISVISVAFIVTAVIMIFVVPSFKEVFTSFGADLPGPTLIVMGISDFFVKFWYVAVGAMFGTVIFLKRLLKRSEKARDTRDKLILRLPIFGEIIKKATIARWTRTLATMFSAGVPLVEALDSVAGASGNSVYVKATKQIQSEISNGASLTSGMQNAKIFPNMVVQMTQIGEESGALDVMLSKVAEFYEREVDDAVASLSSLLEPIIIVFLGVVIGGLVVAMYLPIFKLGAVV